MLFHRFSTQEERRRFGGGDFVELQHCRLKPGTEIEKIVSGGAIRHWQDDSLYIPGDDMNIFYAHYGEIITGGTYANGQCGAVDLCGINYYSAARTADILMQLEKRRPMDYQVLLDWLEGAQDHNGFYVLGL